MRRTLVVVVMKVFEQIALHLLDGLIPGNAALHPQVFVEQRAMKPLDNAIALRSADLVVVRCSILSNCRNRSWGWWSARPQNSRPLSQRAVTHDVGTVRFEQGQEVFVQHVHCRDGQLTGIHPPPGEMAETAT